MLHFVLALWQIRGWKKWEQETLSHDYEFSIGTLFIRFCFEALKFYSFKDSLFNVVQIIQDLGSLMRLLL